MAARFPINITKVESPGCFWGHEVPGQRMSEERRGFMRLCEDLNRDMNDRRSSCNISMSGVSPAEAEGGGIFAAKRAANNKWYRVRIFNLTRRLGGPEVMCELLDFGGNEKVTLNMLKRLPEKFKSFPFQVKQFGLFGLQPQTIVANADDLTSNYELCTEWDLAARDYMNKIKSEARDIHAEIVGVTEENVRWVRVHCEHIDGTCLNDMMVDQQFAQMTKTEKDYDFVNPESLTPTNSFYLGSSTKARLPMHTMSTGLSPSARPGARKTGIHSDMDQSHSEYESDDKEGQRLKDGEKPHRKRKPLVPRVKDATRQNMKRDVQSDFEGSGVKRQNFGIEALSPKLETNVSKSGVVTPVKLGRGGFLSRESSPAVEPKPGSLLRKGSRDVNLQFPSPQRPDLESVVLIDTTPAAETNMDVGDTSPQTMAHGFTDGLTDMPNLEPISYPVELMNANKCPNAGTSPSSEKGAGPRKGFLKQDAQQVGGLLGNFAAITVSNSAAETTQLPSAESLKSPPRKQMKPHIPAKAAQKLSPLRPHQDSSKIQGIVETSAIRENGKNTLPKEDGADTRLKEYDKDSQTKKDLRATQPKDDDKGSQQKEYGKDTKAKEDGKDTRSKEYGKDTEPKEDGEDTQPEEYGNNTQPKSKLPLNTTVASPKVPLCSLSPLGRGLVLGRGLLPAQSPVKPHGLQEKEALKLQSATQLSCATEECQVVNESPLKTLTPSQESATGISSGTTPRGRGFLGRGVVSPVSGNMKPEGLQQLPSTPKTQTTNADVEKTVTSSPAEDKRKGIIVAETELPNNALLNTDAQEQVKENIKSESAIAPDLALKKRDERADESPGMVQDRALSGSGRGRSPLHSLSEMNRKSQMSSPKAPSPGRFDQLRSHVGNVRRSDSQGPKPPLLTMPQSENAQKNNGVKPRSPSTSKPLDDGKSPGKGTSSPNSVTGGRGARLRLLANEAPLIDEKQEAYNSYLKNVLAGYPESSYVPKTSQMQGVHRVSPPRGLGRGVASLVAKSPGKSIKDDILGSMLKTPPGPCVSGMGESDPVNAGNSIKDAILGLMTSPIKDNLLRKPGKSLFDGTVYDVSEIESASEASSPDRKKVSKLSFDRKPRDIRGATKKSEGDSESEIEGSNATVRASEVNQAVGGQLETSAGGATPNATLGIVTKHEGKPISPGPLSPEEIAISNVVADAASVLLSDPVDEKVNAKESKLLNKIIKTDVRESSGTEDELKSIFSDIRSSGKKYRSMCSPVAMETESAAPKEIEDVEKMLGSLPWTSSSSSENKFVPAPYQESAEERQREHSGSPIRSAAEMAWYSADTLDGAEMEEEEIDDIPQLIEADYAKFAVESCEKTNGKVSGAVEVEEEIQPAVSEITARPDSSVISYSVTSTDPSLDKLEPMLHEDTDISEVIHDPTPLQKQEMQTKNTNEDREDGVCEALNIQSEVSQDQDVHLVGASDVDAVQAQPFSIDAPGGISTIVSAIRTWVAVASPTIAESFLLMGSSSVDPVNYSEQKSEEAVVAAAAMPELVPGDHTEPEKDLLELEVTSSLSEISRETKGSDVSLVTEAVPVSLVTEAVPVSLVTEAVSEVSLVTEAVPVSLVTEAVSEVSLVTEAVPELSAAVQNSGEILHVESDGESLCSLPELVEDGSAKDQGLQGEVESEVKPSAAEDTNGTSDVDDGPDAEPSCDIAAAVLPTSSDEQDSSRIQAVDAIPEVSQVKKSPVVAERSQTEDVSDPESAKSKPSQPALRSRLPKFALMKNKEKLEKESNSSSENQEEKPHARSRSVTFSDEEVILDKRKPEIYSTISDDDEEDDEEKALLKELQERSIRQVQLRLEESFAQGDAKRVTGFANFEYYEKEEEIDDTLEKGIFLDGKFTLTSCTRVADSNLFKAMSDVYTDHRIKSATTLQSYVWPALNRGLSMVIISQRYTPTDVIASKVDPILRLTQDITTAYIPPMISKYLYEGIPEGPGPLGVILCSGWRRVEWVMDQCRSYCAHVRIRTEALYGSCGEEAMEIRLLNGCEVLVATPNSLLRMFDKLIIDLGRVMHIVFDDGEILTEQFTEPLTKIMSHYYLAVENRESREPSQLILCGQYWTQAMADFMTKCIPQPQVVIKAKLEAAIYANTHFVVEMCRDQGQLRQLGNFILDPSDKVTKKTLICCQDRESVDLVTQALRAQSHYVLMATDLTYPLDLDEVRREWQTSGQNSEHKPILVAMDSILPDLQIDDVERVIHFDVPKKGVFVERLWTMRANFAKLGKKMKSATTEKAAATPAVRCESVIVMSEEDMSCAPPVAELLRRVQGKIPKDLDNLTKRAILEKEEYSNMPLCQQMCAFGICRNGRQCEGRHVINAELDSRTPNHKVKLPTKGYATIKVTHVIDASFFWARMVHLSDHDVSVPYNLEFVKMTVVMNAMFSSPTNRKTITLPNVGDLVAVRNLQHTWDRAKILSLGKYSKEGEMEEVQAFMVDIGAVRVISLKDCCQLTDNSCFITVPYQAFRVFIADIKPFDDDLEWTKQASLTTARRIGDKEMNGRIVLTLGDTMWLVNLHEQEQLGKRSQIVQSETVTSYLLKAKLAVRNIRHIPLLYSACEGKLDLPEIFNVSKTPGMGLDLYQRPVNFETVKLSRTAKSQQIVIPVVESPDLFYVQMDDAEKLIMDLHFDIGDYLRLGDFEASPSHLIKAGSLVISRMPASQNPDEEDVKWYRGKVLSVKEDNQFEVFYLDFGDIHTLPTDRVKHMPLRFLRPAFQAVECQLAGIKCPGELWEDEAIDGLFSIIWNDQDEAKLLEVKIFGYEKSKTAGLIRHRVQLIDETEGFPVDVSMEMIARRFAAPTQLLLQNLFVTSDQGDLLKLTNLCRQLINASVPAKQKILIDTVYDCCAAILDEEQDERLHEILAHLGQMLGYVPNAGNIMGPVSAILELLLPEDMSEEVLTSVQVIALNLFRILRRISDEEGQCHTLISLIRIAGYDCCHPYIRSDCGGLNFLTTMLYANMDGDLGLLLIKLLYCLLPGALSYAKGVTDSGVITAICLCLSSAEDDELIGWCCMALQHAAARDRWNAEIRKAKVGPKLCASLVEILDGESLLRVLQLIEILVETDRFTAEYFQECGALQRLEKLQSQPKLSNQLKSLVEAVIQKLELDENSLVVETDNLHLITEIELLKKKEQLNTDVATPEGMRALPIVKTEEHVSNRAQPIVKTEEHISNRQPPHIKWAQDKYNIVLTVEVHDVEEAEPATILDNKVTFRAVVLGTEYLFSFDLYELIVPSECQVAVLHSCVNIGLRKKSKGRWPRLLKQKTVKPAYLSVDFEHSLTTDSEGSSDDEIEAKQLDNPLKLLQRRQNKKRLPPPQDSPAKGNPFSNIIPSIPDFDYQPGESSDSSDAVLEKEYDEYNIFDVKGAH